MKSKAEESDVLVVIAHPDDEVFVSGTLCLFAENGFKTTLICATDGEGGSRDLLYSESTLQLGEIRRRELTLSSWMLRVGELWFLGQPDTLTPDAEDASGWDQSTFVSSLGHFIRQCNPKLILTHGPRGGYGHPAHRLVHRCVMTAAQNVSFVGSIFSFCGQVGQAFFSWHFDQPSDVLIDARAFLRRRAASLSYHQTQLNYFVQPHFPRSLRKLASALFGYTFAFCEAGRKRVPIATTTRFFNRVPVEGLVLQKSPEGGKPHFFLENFANAREVQIDR